MANKGLTKSERYLSALARRSFLSLWSHSNLFRGKGTELADLIVVCHNIVLIFSDKNIKFNKDVGIEISWRRWYKKAITESVKQLRRAENWIKHHPSAIFLDAKCEHQIDLFNSVDVPLQIYRIAIANGASDACIRHFGSGSGALVVVPDADPKNPEAFTVGNPAEAGEFVHVFDEANLNVILAELDTISDFVDYLNERRRIFENSSLVVAPSEEDLLAIYLKYTDESGRHALVMESGKATREGDFVAIEEGSYRSYSKRPEYRRKKKADRESYFWDQMIESFAENFRAGTLIPVPEGISQLDGRHGGVELGLRYMALEPRINRRSHSSAILGAFKTLKRSGVNRFFRAMMPVENDERQTCFFILLLHRHGVLGDLTYDEYRQIRASTAHAYAQNLLMRNQKFKRVVGLATEGEVGRGRSEDLVFQEVPEWTEELVKETERLAEVHEIFRNVKETPFSAKEYPETELGLRGGYSPIPYRYVDPPLMPPPQLLKGNRKERRKAAATMRKSRRR